MNLAEVRIGFLAAGFPEAVVDETLLAYEEAKRRFHLGDHRPHEVEGGRFSEAVFRLLQHQCGFAVTPIGKTLPSVDSLLRTFESAAGHPDAVRLHIPRTLKLIYDIRNKRDVAHLADGIDPNLQDATLVTANMDWVLAELVRLHHAVDANKAQAIIATLIRREVPAIEEIGGQPVLLKDLQPKDQALLMLYRAGSDGIQLDDLLGQLRTHRKDHLRTRIQRLDAQHTVYYDADTERAFITALGSADVESRGLAKPAAPTFR